MSFEENLDRLAEIINKSRNKKLKAAFALYLQSFNQSLRNYVSFLQFLNAFQAPSYQREEWNIFERG